jgi:hypothetical protein
MRPFWLTLKRMSIMILLVVALLWGLLAIIFPSSTPPKEEKVIQNFHPHRPDFERLRDMLLADKQLLSCS